MSSDVQTIGKYRILGELGRGAMGLVYRAEDTLLRRQVALKVITGDDVSDEAKARFHHEARAAAALDHPNIVVVHDLGEEGGQPYIAMELLKGEDLKGLMRRRPVLPVAEATEIVLQVCQGLAYAHERRIVHRDIKPANVHICPDGRVKIVDFGVAKMESSSLTKTGMVIGTPDYMSPEQIQGKGVDSRSDIFSTGVVFYELLTRNKPFRAESITSVIYNIVFKVPATFAELDVDAPPEVERIIAKAMAKDLADRYQDIKDMAADLRAVQEGLRPGGTVAASPRPAAASTDATAALSEAEVSAATRSMGAADRTVQVGESATQRAGTGVGGTMAATVLSEGATQLAAAPAKSRLPLILGGAAAVVVLAVVALAALLGGEEARAPAGSPAPAAAPTAAARAVEIVVAPWAVVESVERLDGPEPGKQPVPNPATTPLRLDLQPGRYRLELHNPALALSDVMEFDVGSSGPQSVRHVLARFDAAAALEAALPGLTP